jgi:hypothetical protein
MRDDLKGVSKRRFCLGFDPYPGREVQQLVRKSFKTKA